MSFRSMAAALLITATLTAWAAQASPPAREPTFAVSFPGGLGPAGPPDGRVILMISRDFKREPRSHASPNMPLDSPYLFGLNVEGLAAGHEAVINRRAFGWPAARLSALPAGDYNVQYLPKILERIARRRRPVRILRAGAIDSGSAMFRGEASGGDGRGLLRNCVSSSKPLRAMR